MFKEIILMHHPRAHKLKMCSNPEQAALVYALNVYLFSQNIEQK